MIMLNFPAVAEILIKYTNAILAKNTATFMETLFNSYLNTEECKDYEISLSMVSKWLSGKRDLPSGLKCYYTNENMIDLHYDIEIGILPEINDYDKAISDIKKILFADISISEKKKDEISRLYTEKNEESAADFITAIVFFAMHRHASLPSSSIFIGDIILNCNVPKPCTYFCGRNIDTENLHKSLSDNSKVFIRGIAGIGKSEFIKHYAKVYKKDYTNILYIMYSGNLRNDITNMHFIDDGQSDSREKLFNKHFQLLQSLESDSLLIIDNFDTTSDKEKLFDDILNLRCKVIFTTRYSFESEYIFMLSEISDIEDFVNIAKYIYSNTDSHITIIKEIANTVYKHTLSFEMAVRLLEKGIFKPIEILNKLKTENIKLSSLDKIKIKKDGNTEKEVYYEHIKKLFSMQKLSSKEIDVMRSLCLLSLTGMQIDLFSSFMCMKDLNVINDLEEYGFLKINNKNISLHPLVRDVALSETKPSVTNCRKFLCNIKEKAKDFMRDVQDYTAFFINIESIINHIIINNNRTYLTFLKDVFPYMEKYSYESGMRLIVAEMEKIIPKIINLYPEDTALMLDYKATIEELYNNNLKKALEIQKSAVKTINTRKLTKKNAELYSNLYANLGGYYARISDFINAEYYTRNALRILYDYKKFNTINALIQIVNYANIINSMGYCENALPIIQDCCYMLENNGLDNSIEYASVKQVQGNIYLTQKQIENAINCYKITLKIYQTKCEPKLFEEKVKEICGIGIDQRLLIETK